jgi:hypothetical protein
MKNNSKKIIIVTLLLIIAGFSGYFLYSDIQQKNINKDFSFDVIKSLNEVYTSRGLDDEEKESNQFESAYFMKEHVSNAKDIMKKWVSDKDKLRKKVATSMIDGIDDLLVASDAYIDLMKNPSSHEKNLALFKVKLEEGRKDLWLGASGLILEDGGIKLSKSQKQDVINYIENVFEKELDTYKKYQESEEKDENFNQPQEVWATIIIRNGLSK